MFTQPRFILGLIIAALALTLSGCAGTNVNTVAPVNNETVVIPVQFIDGIEVGPLYNMSVNVPQDWVGKFQSRSVGNKVYFDYLTGSGAAAPIFFIEALSPSQYWDQNGAHPTSYINLINRGDTFFVYYLPIDAYYSGLPKQEFDTFAAAVPGIVSSFAAEAAN